MSEPTDSPPPQSIAIKVLTRVVLPVAIVAMGLLCAVTLVKLKPVAERAEPPPRVATVEVIDPQSGTATAQVVATGTVTASQQVMLSPEVAGKLTWVSPQLRPGGRFAKGKALAKVDPRDYEIAVAQEKSRVKQAELEYELELGRQQVAAKEYALLGEGADNALALRKPHLKLSEQNLEAARASLRRAELNLQRTSLTAPFDAVVVAENVDLGQVVGGGTQVASLVGTERFRITVDVPVHQLAKIVVPKDGADGSLAQVVHEQGERKITRIGRVIGTGGQLDPATRTAQVLIAVDDPLDPPEGSEPLWAGAYVTVRIAGDALPEVTPLPREALHEGRYVWVADKDRTLRKRTVAVEWSDGDSVYLAGGLQPGDRVVVSPLPMPIDGMPLSVRLAAQGDGAGTGGRSER